MPVLIGEAGRQIPDRIIENDVNGYVGRNTALFDPNEDGMDFFESLESMRVQVNNAIVVSSINSYNEVIVVADMGKNASGLSPAGVLLLAEDDPNPERIMLDDKFIRMPDLLVGDVFTQPIVGIVDYDFGNYKIQPTEKIVFQTMGLVEKITDIELPVLTSTQISVANLNLLNLCHLESPVRVAGFASMIINDLGSPDILVLQEVMDDDGRLNSAVVSAEKNLASFAGAIKEKGGPDYRWFNIDPERNTDGGVNGGNIRVVIMFRLDRGLRFLSATPGKAGQEVGLKGQGTDLALTNNPGLIWPNNYAFGQSRKPIVAQFQFMDQNFFVIGVHFNSKGPDGPLYGDRQPPNLDSEKQRIAQAKAVNGFVKDILERDPHAKILVSGDLNDFPWTDSVQTLAGTQLTNLFDTIDRELWFTYIHEGNAQVMDQMLVSESFMQNFSTFRPLNLNSVLAADDQLSDHDPIIAIFDFAYYE
jgi:predicted extracellular nuclease